ncbi:MAG: serine/threonine-protein kinase [Gemmatimonadota bacterium]|nr:serine/threonine-protein kinase [Gemmatimonadota bacterium]
MSDLLAELSEALEARYELLRELGSGGMAHVFLGRDLKHDRLVAIKVLRPELAASVGIERFLREIQVAAKLSHPHILPLYDSGEAGGRLFYTMPFVEGESLADRMTREQQLPVFEAVQITREVAEALGYAHSHGVVHRDIKPDNVMLASGHAIVADFGIARALDAAGADSLTQTGMAIGTPAYMSPEQVSGAEDVDGRSDIYSLGCVLYELLVGQVPFTGPTPQAVMARHSVDAVPRPQIVRDTIPDDLEDIILCSMAKSRADRFRTAMDFADALRVVETGTGTLPRMSRAVTAQGSTLRKPKAQVPVRNVAIAAGVLSLAAFGFWVKGDGRTVSVESGGLDPARVAVRYFEDFSNDGSLEHMAAGFTEGLIERLSLVRGLDVISENGVLQFKGTNATRDSIAKVLEAGSLIEGSVESRRDELLITVRLIDGASGAEVERNSWENIPADSFLVVQDQLADEVTRFLRERLGEEIRLQETRRATTNVEAWSLVQRGERLRHFAEEMVNDADRTKSSVAFDEADSLLALAQRLDDSWPEPPLQRGWIDLGRMITSRGTGVAEWYEDGLVHAERVLELGGERARALELRGTLGFTFWRLEEVGPDDEDRVFEQARADLEEAVRLDPSLASANVTLSKLYYDAEENELALMAARDAYEEDAFLRDADEILSRLFWTHLDLEQLRPARDWCEVGYERFPEHFQFSRCRLWLMITPVVPDVSVEEGWEVARQFKSLLPDVAIDRGSIEADMVMGGVLAKASLPDSARAVMERARARITFANDPTQFNLSVEALNRILLKDYDEAIDLLKRYVAANPEHEFEEVLGTVWWWREIREHPRFSEILTVER